MLCARKDGKRSGNSSGSVTGTRSGDSMRDEYDRSDEEMYVYDQCCENCRYYCDWEDEENNGCKHYSRPDYQQHPPSHWCCDWKGKRA